MPTKSIGQEFTKGLWDENPVFRQLLGLCPTLAVTGWVINGLAMGLATTFVLIFSSLVISSIKKLIPSQVRIATFIVVIASFVTIVDLVMHGFFYELHKNLGLFIPLIVVNCIILGRAEAFASRNGLLHSMVDGIGMGLGFTLGLMVLGAVREVLGNGTLLGYSLFGPDFPPMLVMILPPGIRRTRR